jgi:hypothetical protein
MRQPACPTPLCLFAGAALLLFASLAQAQYVWIDAKGLRQYSDRPPPPSTPAAKIIKAPGSPAAAPLVDTTEPASAPADVQVPAKKGPPTLAERDADFNKRQQARAEQERKAADEAQRKQAMSEECASARQYKAQLEAGIRIADTAADGERAYIGEEERARRVGKIRRILDGCR